MEDKFEVIWSEYPKRRGSKGSKKTARIAVENAIEIYGFEALLTAVKNYKLECESRGVIDTEYVKQFLSWINCGRNREREKGRRLGVEHYQEAIEQTVADPKWQKVRYFALKESNGSCCLCGRTAKDGIKLHVDHIKPKSLYPELEYEPSNLQVLCCDCNIGKSNLDDTDWR